MITSATLIALQAANAAPREDVYLFVSVGLLGLAILLLALELFVPTGGVLAVLTGVSAVASVASMFVYDTTWGGIYLAVVCAGRPVAVILVFKIWSKTPIARRMVLKAGADGSHSDDVDDAPGQDPASASMGVSARTTARSLEGYIGKRGVAATTLRPVGFVRIDGARLDAVAESGFIAGDREVIVIEVLEGQLKVREASPPQPG